MTPTVNASPDPTKSTIWCATTATGNPCQFVTIGGRLPSIHHDPQTGFVHVIASGHPLGTGPTCASCHPAPAPGQPREIDVKPLPLDVAVCTGCLAEATADHAAHSVTDRNAAFVLIPDNNRDGMSACSAHLHDVRWAMASWPDDRTSWNELVDRFRKRLRNR